MTPYELRHTSETLGSHMRYLIITISQGLTHVDAKTTQVYINSRNSIEQTPADFGYNIMTDQSQLFK